MKNNLVLAAILSTVTTSGGTIVYHLARQNKLAQEAAAQQRKEQIERQVEIQVNKDDAQKTRKMLLDRYPIDQNLTPEQKERQESARRLNESFGKAYNKEMGRSAKPTSTPTPNN